MIEIFLAILSFIFAKINKFLIGNIYTIYLTINQKKSQQWRVIDNNLVSSNINLGVLITKAPRWNTHAIIGTLGPFFVENNLTIDLKSANNSSDSWIAIFYDFPNYKTITTIESNQVSPTENYHTINLPKGKYTIGLRYYNYHKKLVLPAIKIDGQDFISSKEIPSNSNQFYDRLIERKNVYFLAIHYYIYTILKYRQKLPESFVQNEFLPVGATDTKFYYDCLDIGQILTIKINEFTLNNYDIYVTIYDQCSLPIDSFQVHQLEEKTLPLTNKGYYLIRVRRNLNIHNKFEQLNIHLNIA